MCALLTGITVVLYVRTLSFEFVFDDWAYVLENPLLMRARSFLYPLSFAEFATAGEREGFDPDLCTNFILRPVTYLTLHLNWLMGGFDPSGFRFVNIMIHAANACLIAVLLSRWLPGDAEARRSPAVVGFGSFSAALLFAVHPMQIESVTYVTQRFESLATLFYLATCLAYDRYLRTGSVPWRRASLVLLMMGLLSKETVVTAPLMLVSIDCLLHGSKVRAALWRARLHLAAILVVPALLAATSWAQNGRSFSAHNMVNITNVNLDPIPPLDYARTQICAWLSYLRLLLWPAGQNGDVDYPAVTSWTDARFVASAFVVGLVITSAIGVFLRKGGRESRPATLLVLGVLWFFVTLLPSSSFVPLPDLFVEHRSYLPSIGAAMVVAAVVEALRRRSSKQGSLRVAPAAVIGCMALVLSVANWRRNEVWRSEVSFWQDATAKSANKARPWQSLGTALAAQGDKQGGLDCLKRALAIEPRFLPAWVNLVLIHLELGELDEAERASRDALRLYPDTPSLHHNLGMILAQRGSLQDAIQCFRRALELQPSAVDSHVSLAHIYRRVSDHRSAIQHLRAALDLRPGDDDLRELLASVQNESRGISQTATP